MRKLEDRLQNQEDKPQEDDFDGCWAQLDEGNHLGDTNLMV